MAKAVTKSQIIAKIADDAGISKVQAKCALESIIEQAYNCLLYTSPSPRDRTRSRMPSSA